jgi:glycosyltransferase involved in cell wall biosynthesis
MPFLSIVVPIYNAEKYLVECLDSIFKQTFKDFEVILVNDGSKDGSLKICEKYKKKYENIKIINKENGGIVSARKAGVEVAVGEYIGYVDSDDFIESIMYENMCNEAGKTGADIVICDACNWNGKIKTPLPQTIQGGFYNKEGLIKNVYPYMLMNGKEYGFGFLPALWNKIFRADILKRNQLIVDDCIIIGEDVACSYFCMLEANSISYLKNKVYYYYRINEGSACHVWSNDKIYATLILLEFLYKRFNETWCTDCISQYWWYYSYMYTNILYEYRKSKGSQWNTNPGIIKDFEALLNTETMGKFVDLYDNMDIKFKRKIAINYMINPSRINSFLWSLVEFVTKIFAYISSTLDSIRIKLDK